MTGRRIYYGWVLAVVGLPLYGLTLGPAYGWGFFGPELRNDLALSAGQFGNIFALWALIYHSGSVPAGTLIRRWGLRVTISLGLSITALGFWALSYARSGLEFLLAFSVLTGIGIGLSSVLPFQTLATYWFKRYRARALAIIMMGSMVIGALVNPANDYLLHHGGWRAAARAYAVLSLLTAAVAALLIRNSPESIGCRPDGVDEAEFQRLEAEAKKLPPPRRWTAREAMLTRQFMLIAFCSMTFIGPWTTLSSSGRLHFSAFGYSSTFIALLLSLKDSMSAVGRLLASVGDFVAPRRVLVVALIMEGIGIAGLGIARTSSIAYVSSVLFGLGFGGVAVCIPLTLAQFFGREVFAVTAGTSRMLQGVFSAAAPSLAGLVADATGSYTIPFVALGALTAVGAFGILFCGPITGAPIVAAGVSGGVPSPIATALPAQPPS